MLKRQSASGSHSRHISVSKHVLSACFDCLQSVFAHLLLLRCRVSRAARLADHRASDSTAWWTRVEWRASDCSDSISISEQAVEQMIERCGSEVQTGGQMHV